jgi:serine/threonine-protein kinase
MRSEAIKPGDVIAGKYRVRAIMSRQRGFLVEAFHTEFDQRVVIRVLSPAIVDDKEVERFRRESRTLAKLESEHVARIVDVGKTQDGAFFFARQYLEGQDLAATLKARGPLPLAEAVLFILQAAEAVVECHTHSILLREMQPSHLFVTQRLGGSPQLKLIDFGTAKLMRDAAAPTAGGELTATAMFGMSCYSSPELVRKAQHIDARTDVWSLGAIFYQLLTGRAPFEGEMAALMLAITRDEPVPVTRYRREVPPEIDQIIGWALAKDVDGRFANVHAFAHALTPFASPEGQVLIQRIGQITAAGKQRRKEAVPAPTMDRDHPETFDGADLVEDDDPDDVRTAYRPPDAPVVGPQYRSPQAAQAAPPNKQDDGPPLERTMFIVPGFVPPTPGAPTAPRPAAGGGAGGPGGGASPGPSYGGAAADMGRGSQPGAGPGPVWQPIGGSGGPQGGQQQNGARPPAAAMATIQSSSVPSGYSAPGAKPQPKGQKVALAAVAGAVVLLSVVAVFVVLKGHGAEGGVGPEGTSAATTSSATASAAPVVSAVPSADPTVPAGPASAVPSADPVAVPTPSAVPTANPGTRVASVATAGPGKTPPGGKVKTEPTSAPVKVDPPPPPAGGGDNGTLVAVAVGGSCAFSVNGASKGTMATLKMSVKPGTYSVTCAPSTGASKSKSVTVASGGTAMAMFKLQ